MRAVRDRVDQAAAAATEPPSVARDVDDLDPYESMDSVQHRQSGPRL
jgi:hypothetical protein